jgi:hypothetical protein
LLGRRRPWFRQGQSRDDDRHYAVCPYCDNPVQLKGLYRRQENSTRPHGSHTGGPIDGFPNFSEIDLAFCPYRIKKQSHSKTSRRNMGPAAKQLIHLAVSEFDRIVLLLRDDFGFPFSSQFAGNMLEQWFDSKGYLYTGAHLRNLPWIIAYFGPTQSLYGQFIDNNVDLTNSIRERVTGATISDSGQLLKSKAWFRVELQCLHHRVGDATTSSAALSEHITLRVQDFTNTNTPEKAPVLYKKKIIFDPDRFERLINTPVDRAKRYPPLLEIAEKISEKWRV